MIETKDAKQASSVIKFLSIKARVTLERPSCTKVTVQRPWIYQKYVIFIGRKATNLTGQKTGDTASEHKIAMQILEMDRES